jgi:hypothetical protein
MESIEIMKIKDIAKVLVIRGIGVGDSVIIEEAGVTTADLDQFYKQAEAAVTKARDKAPEVPAAGFDMVREANGWVDFLCTPGGRMAPGDYLPDNDKRKA